MPAYPIFVLDLLLWAFAEHTYGKLHCQNNLGPLKKMMGFLEVSRKTFPSICKEYMVTWRTGRVGRREPALLSNVQPCICVNCVKGARAVSEVMKYVDICTKPWSWWRHRLWINVRGVRVSVGFFPLLLSRPDAYCKRHFLSKRLILRVVKRLSGRVDLASPPNIKKAVESLQPFIALSKFIRLDPVASLKACQRLRFKLGFSKDVWRGTYQQCPGSMGMTCTPSVPLRTLSLQFCDVN